MTKQGAALRDAAQRPSVLVGMESFQIEGRRAAVPPSSLPARRPPPNTTARPAMPSNRSCPHCRKPIEFAPRDFESLPTRDRERIVERYLAVRRDLSGAETRPGLGGQRRPRLAVFDPGPDGSGIARPASQ